MSTRNINVLLTGNSTSLRGALMSAGKEVDTFKHKVDDAGTSGISKAKLLGAAVLTAGVLVAAGLTYAVAAAAKFDASMRNVQSITKVTEQEFRAQEKAVIDMSKRLPQSAATLADGLYDIASSGFAGAEGLQILEASGRAASAGLTDTAVASKAIVAVLNAYGMEAKDAADVSDILFQGVNLGVISFEELGGVIGDVVGTAAAATVEIDEVTAAVATMTLSGISGAEAGTSLNRVIQSLIDPSDELAAALKGVGYESGAQALQVDDLSVVMDKLRIASGGNIETLLKWFPEIRAARGALALMAAGGENYKRVVAGIQDEEARAGATQAALNEQMKSLSMQWKLFTNRINAGAIALGTQLIPVVITVMGALESLIQSGIDPVTAALKMMAPFWDSLVQIGGDVVEIADQMLDTLGPVAGVLAGMVAIGVIQSLKMLADALEAVTGFLVDHPGLVKALAAVMGGMFVGSLMKAAGATRLLWADGMRLRALYALDFFGSIMARMGQFVSGLWEVVQVGGSATGGISKMKGALQGLGAALGSPAVIGTAMVVGLGLIIAGEQKARREAEEFRKELERGINWKVPSSIIAGTRKISDELDHLRERQNSTTGISGAFNTVRQAAQVAASGVGIMDDKMREVSVGIRELSEAERKNLGLAAQLQEKYSVVATRLDMSTAAVQAFVVASDLDPSVMSYNELEEAIGQTATITEKGTPIQAKMADQMGKVADETSSAADEVDAFKSALDDLIGLQKNWFDTNTKSAEAMDNLKGSIMTTVAEGTSIKDLFNTVTEGGRANRDAISGTVDAWMDMAGAMADQGDMQGAVLLLESLDQQLRTMLEGAGMSKGEIDGLLESLGLFPGNYEAMLELTGKDEALTGLADMVANLEEVDGTTATATVKMIDATGYTTTDIDEWILQYAMSDPTARVMVDDEPAKPTQAALELWAERFEDSDPTALALMSILDPQGKYKNLAAMARDYEGWNPTTNAKVNTRTAEEQLRIFRANEAMKQVTIPVVIGGKTYTRPNRADARWGQVTAYANGGITPAHITSTEMMKYGEPETGGEAYVPRRGNHQRSSAILQEAASWYGYQLAPADRGRRSQGLDRSEGTHDLIPNMRHARSSLRRAASTWEDGKTRNDVPADKLWALANGLKTSILMAWQALNQGRVPIPTEPAVRREIYIATDRHHQMTKQLRAGRYTPKGAGYIQAEDGSWVAPSFYNKTSYATGGVTPAHVTKTQLIKYGEPETGGEAFIPKLGDHRRSASILAEAASWYGLAVVPMARGGVLSQPGQGSGIPTAAAIAAAAGQASPVRVIIDGNGIDRTLLEWLRKSVRVEGGGSVQVALGQGT